MIMARKTKTRIWRNYVAETLIWALIYTGCLFVFRQQASFVVAGTSVNNNVTTADTIKPKAIPIQEGELQHVPKEKLAKFTKKFKSLVEENERIVDEYKSLLGYTLDVEVEKERTDRRFDCRFTSPITSETVGTHIDTLTDSDRTRVHSKTMHTPLNQDDPDHDMTIAVDMNSNDEYNKNLQVIPIVEQCDSSSQTEYLDMMVISRENKVKIDKLPPTKYWKELRANQRQQWNICLVNVTNNDTFVKDACIETEVTSTISCQTDDEMSSSIFDNYIQERFLHDLTFSPQKCRLYDDTGTEKLEDIEFWNAEDVKSVWSASSSSSRSSRSRCASLSSLTSGADSFEQMCGTPDKLSHKSFNDSAIELCSLRSQTSSPGEAQPNSNQTEIMEVRRRPKQNRRRSSQDINNRDSAISMTFTDSESNISESLNDMNQGVNFDLGDSLVLSPKQADRNELRRAYRQNHTDEERLKSKKDYNGTNKHTFKGNKSIVSEMELLTSSDTSTQYEKLGQMSISSQCSVKSRDSETQYEPKEMKPITNNCGIQCSGATSDADITEVGSQHEKYWLSQGTQYEMNDIQHDLPGVSINRNTPISNSPRLNKDEVTKNHSRESSNRGTQKDAAVEEQTNAKGNIEGLSNSIIETSNRTQEYEDHGDGKDDVDNTSNETTPGKLAKPFSRENLLRVLEESFPDVKHPRFFSDIVEYAMNISPRFVAKNMKQGEKKDIEQEEIYENLILAKTVEVGIPNMTETGVQTDKIPWLASQPLIDYPPMSQIIRVVRPGPPMVFERCKPYKPIIFRR
ncbi:unnamed protein product [Owenia fusiformis]|uniref:Uncharacterized protein n=1 Tax=Owenia fusiformis TaxID=6347 RepID=A0A8J1UHG2_OWEFU|nr:unnamed protein product [Owenia fusiformis]